MNIVKMPANSIVLSLTSEEASKLYNLTCFFNRASQRGQIDHLVGNGTGRMNSNLQRILFEQGIEPDYDKAEGG